MPSPAQLLHLFMSGNSSWTYMATTLTYILLRTLQVYSSQLVLNHSFNKTTSHYTMGRLKC